MQMKLSRTNKVYLISMGILAGNVLLILLFWLLHLMGVSIDHIPIVLNVALSEAILLIPVGIYLWFEKVRPNEFIPHKILKPSVVFLLIVFAWLVTPLMMTINAISMLFVENAITDTVDEVMQFPWAVGVILIALIPAVVEEFVCRGVIFHRLRHNGIWKAIFVSALLFGIMHMNFNQLSYAFALGIVLALCVEATDSIFASIIVHFTFNATSLTLNYVLNAVAPNLVEQGTESLQVGTPEYIMSMISAILLYGFVSIFTTSLAISVFWLIAKKCDRDWCMKLLFTGKTGPYPVKERVVTPLFIIFVVVAVILMLWLG